MGKIKRFCYMLFQECSPTLTHWQFQLLGWMRFMLRVSILLFFAIGPYAVYPFPTLEEAHVYEGTLVRIVVGRRGDGIAIEGDRGEIFFRTAIYNEQNEFSPHLNSEVKAWYGKNYALFVFPYSNSLVKLTAGETVVRNLWAQPDFELVAPRGFKIIIAMLMVSLLICTWIIRTGRKREARSSTDVH